MAVLSTLRGSEYELENYERSSETDTQVEETVVENDGYFDVVEDEVTVYENGDIIDEIGDEFRETKDEIEEDIVENDFVQEDDSIYENEVVTEEVTEIGAEGGVWRNW
jgi:hypothetical protein